MTTTTDTPKLATYRIRRVFEGYDLYAVTAASEEEAVEYLENILATYDEADGDPCITVIKHGEIYNSYLEPAGEE